MNCYLWELEAILEGLALRELDKQEQNAIFGFNLRYILNAKKPQMNKILNKKKAEDKIRKAFTRNQKQVNKNHHRLEKAMQALEHFRNRR
ncbi:MAG: hypothetical protein MR320_04210 [Enterococcus gallinarum]|uniref:hypothetical protein n=1 Tax=Enterococcus TaxID=1350 RepID=UPI0009860936|nr:hypothetical protein [Enterococcus faecium]MCI5684578.1 hypothetical protein [Enterococcus gallinarum]MCO5533767.1 hypothetical protein [Enterococcus faecium]MDY4071004.1 hypothetical protein [Enterococcus gallinarum]OOG28442.1 hypothetical protein BZK37_01505 [Enterococcus casseliflavus]